MKVKELIEELKKLPQDAEVVMSKDEEGNDFSPFAEAAMGKYHAETTWYGQWYGENQKEYEAEFDNPDFEFPEGSIDAVCLWPIN